MGTRRSPVRSGGGANLEPEDEAAVTTESAPRCALTTPEHDPDETSHRALGPTPPVSACPRCPEPCPGGGTVAEHRRHPRRRPGLRRCRLLWRDEGPDAEYR